MDADLPGDCVVADCEFSAAGVFDAVRAAGAFFVDRHRTPNGLHGRTPLGAGVRPADRTVREQTGRRSRRCRRVPQAGHHLPTPLAIFERGEVGPQPDWDAATVRAWLRRMARKVDPAKYEKSTGRQPGSARGKPPRWPHEHESTHRLLDGRAKAKRKVPRKAYLAEAGYRRGR